MNCTDFIKNVDNNFISDEELSFLVGYLSDGSELTENEFNGLLNIIYNICDKNKNNSVGNVLDYILEKSSK